MPSTIRINEGARFIMRCTTRDRPSLLWPGNLDPRAGAGVMATESLSEVVPRRSLLTTVEDLQPFASAPRPAPRAARCILKSVPFGSSPYPPAIALHVRP